MNKLLVYFALTVALVLRAQCIHYDCPQKDVKDGCNGPTDCLYPNQENCNSFIKCTAADLAYLMQCPSNLEWNNHLKICDWPESSTCGIKLPHQSPKETPKLIPKFICPVRDIIRTGCKGPKDCLYTNIENCNTFIKCTVNGEPVVIRCPSGLKWNARDKICDWRSSATCKWIKE